MLWHIWICSNTVFVLSLLWYICVIVVVVSIQSCYDNATSSRIQWQLAAHNVPTQRFNHSLLSRAQNQRKMLVHIDVRSHACRAFSSIHLKFWLIFDNFRIRHFAHQKKTASNVNNTLCIWNCETYVNKIDTHTQHCSEEKRKEKITATTIAMPKRRRNQIVAYRKCA